jgi:ABC-type glycerol-3-phosphate transport system permease component
VTAVAAAQEPLTSRRAHFSVARAAVFAALLILAFVILAPFVYVFLVAFQVNGRYSMANWHILFQSLALGREMVNSAILATGAAVCTVIVASLAGFAFAKLPFPGSQALLVLSVATIAIPVISIIVPEYVNFSNVGLLGSYPGTIVLYTAFSSGLGVFFMTSYFRNLPDSLTESALVDGASYLKIYRRIILPVSTPAMMTVGVLVFIIVWNDLLVALLFMPGTDTRTAGVGLATLASQHSANLGPVMAGSLLTTIPCVVAYIFFQRYLVAGLTMGADR